MTDPEIDAKLRLRGYAPALEVAKKLGVHRSTVTRWYQSGEIEVMEVGAEHYVLVSSVVAKVSPEFATIVGLIQEKST